MVDLYLARQIKKRVWKEYMEKRMKKENAWDQMTEIGMVEGPVEEISLEEKTSAIKKIKLGKAFGLSKVSMEIMNASGKAGIDMMTKLFQRVPDGKGILPSAFFLYAFLVWINSASFGFSQQFDHHKKPVLSIPLRDTKDV